MLATQKKNRNAKAELNRRSQACDVLADTGIRVAENGRAWGYRAIYFGLEDRRVSLNTYARKMESRPGVAPG
jgi:hypothetical protein